MSDYNSAASTSYISLRPYPCQEAGCTKGFSNNRNLRSHVRTDHPSAPYPDIQACQWPNCKFKWENHQTYESHWRTVHLPVTTLHAPAKTPRSGGQRREGSASGSQGFQKYKGEPSFGSVCGVDMSLGSHNVFASNMGTGSGDAGVYAENSTSHNVSGGSSHSGYLNTPRYATALDSHNIFGNVNVPIYAATSVSQNDPASKFNTSNTSVSEPYQTFKYSESAELNTTYRQPEVNIQQRFYCRRSYICYALDFTTQDDLDEHVRNVHFELGFAPTPAARDWQDLPQPPDNHNNQQSTTPPKILKSQAISNTNPTSTQQQSNDIASMKKVARKSLPSAKPAQQGTSASIPPQQSSPLPPRPRPRPVMCSSAPNNDDDEISSGPSFEDSDDEDFEQSNHSDGGDVKRAYTCPKPDCNFTHINAAGIERHWITKHSQLAFPGVRFARDRSSHQQAELLPTRGVRTQAESLPTRGVPREAELLPTRGVRTQSQPSTMNNTIQPSGFSPAHPQNETEFPGFVFKPSYDRQFDSSSSRPSDRAPANKPPRARRSSPGASTAQRPMGAVSFAKMALFHQNEDEDDLRPLPRPPIPAGNVAWSDEEEEDVETNDHETKSQMSVRTDSPEPSHLQRFLAASTTDLLYKNPDDSDSDMSSSIGQVDETTDLDSFMHFPLPLPGVAKSSIAAPAADYPFQYRRALVPHKPVPLNVSLDPETPHISWVARRAKELAEKEDEDAVPGITVARTNKKIRRRLELYSNKPKRKYVWKTENKNKRKSAGGKASERTAGERTSSEGNTDRTPETSTSTTRTQKRTSTTTRGIMRSTDRAEDEAASHEGRLGMRSRSSVLGKRGRVGEVRGEANLKRRRVPVVEDDDEDEDEDDGEDYDEDYDEDDDDGDDKDFVR